VPRSAVAVTLPSAELAAVREHLTEAGYEAIPVTSADELEELLATRSDVRCAILDGETDFDATLEMYGVLRDGDRNIPALMLMPPRALGRMGLGGRPDARDEYFTRPYSPESLRWRVEAMLIRVENVPADLPDVGAILAAGPADHETATEPVDSAAVAVPTPKRGRVIIVFNPKGGVGKTTISINLGSAMQIRKHQRVLLVDCDTITGHIAASLGLQRPRTLASAWRDSAGNGADESIAQIASIHSSGVGVLVMAESPLHTEILEPKRVAEAIAAARDFYDWVILDMHPDYGPLNQALFDQADTILVPVTPDVPCIRAAVQFRELAVELEIRDRLTMVINRANSGVAGGDVERVVGIPAVARIRSAGMLFVRAADEGKSAVERFPTAKVIGDIDALADRLISSAESGSNSTQANRPSHNRFTDSFRGFFGRITTQVS
jgi:MinD-like ATPase involved in chromosome partitioning or flagellar assembly